MDIYAVQGVVTITVTVNREIEAFSKKEAEQIFLDDGATHELADLEHAKGRGNIDDIEIDFVKETI